jgi:hypothetical protein
LKILFPRFWDWVRSCGFFVEDFLTLYKPEGLILCKIRFGKGAAGVLIRELSASGVFVLLLLLLDDEQLDSTDSCFNRSRKKSKNLKMMNP